MSGLKFRQSAKQFRRKWNNVGETIRFGTQHNHGERQVFDFLFTRKIFTHRHKHIELSRTGDQPEQLAVLDARPARLRDGLHVVAGQIPAQTRGQTFIEQDAHSGGDQHPFAGFFEEGDGLFAGDGGKILQKIVERIAAFDVIN